MVMQATRTFFTDHRTKITKGQIFADDADVVARVPSMFVILDDDGTGVPLVESATRVPGERSLVRRPGPDPDETARIDAELAAAAEFAAAEAEREAAETAAAALKADSKKS